MAHSGNPHRCVRQVSLPQFPTEGVEAVIAAKFLFSCALFERKPEPSEPTEYNAVEVTSRQAAQVMCAAASGYIDSLPNQVADYTGHRIDVYKVWELNLLFGA